MEPSPSKPLRILARLTDPQRVWIVLGAILLLGSALRGRAIARDWLWYDEYYSAVFASSLDFESALAAIEQFDFHPPLYYWQLHLWAGISRTELWLLGNSVMWGVIALAGVFLAAHHLAKLPGAVSSGLLFALFMPALQQSSQLRMYSMLMGLSAWATYFSLRQLTAPSPGKWALLAGVAAVAGGAP